MPIARLSLTSKSLNAWVGEGKYVVMTIVSLIWPKTNEINTQTQNKANIDFLQKSTICILAIKCLTICRSTLIIASLILIARKKNYIDPGVSVSSGLRPLCIDW